MNKFLICFLIFGLMACKGENNDNPGGQVPGNNNGDVVDPITNQWGDLPCQQNLSCDNPVLNLEYDILKEFIEIKFPQNIKQTDSSDVASISCGRHFMSEWIDYFPQHVGLELSEVAAITEFARIVMDIKKCTNKEDINKQMQTYLSNTKEYKNVY